MGSDRAALPSLVTPHVSIHAPAWGATGRPCHPWSRPIVSIHAPAWGATCSAQRRRITSQFQFTLPHGERRGIPSEPGMEGCFNSRSRMGSDQGVLEAGCDRGVSIHAPAWGATAPNHPQTEPAGVSIHAPAWGATARPPRGNPRRAVSIHAPAWGATPLIAIPPVVSVVSIHAPAWGATTLAASDNRRDSVSIHAPAWGATGQIRAPRGALRFQFTLPHGERRLAPRRGA